MRNGNVTEKDTVKTELIPLTYNSLSPPRFLKQFDLKNRLSTVFVFEGVK